MKHFAVFGNPIAHSKSPQIHAAFAEQFGIELSYEKVLADVGQFAATASHFFEDADGANVTVPFKQDALLFADELSTDAKLAGAVNTLTKKQGRIIGDNTDGIGLVTDIRDNHSISFGNKKVLIIGAGGASRGVILPIARQQPTTITIANRTLAKAVQLAEQFSDYAAITAEKFAGIKTPFDIIINATSASLSGDKLPLPPASLTSNTFAYDMMYGAEPTAFMQFASSNGATAVDGLGMLVEQAAKSFEIWHNVKPQTQAVINSIRYDLQQSQKKTSTHPVSEVKL